MAFYAVVGEWDLGMAPDRIVLMRIVELSVRQCAMFCSSCPLRF